MSIEDILKGKSPDPLVAEIPIEGFGKVKVHQLSVSERFDYEKSIAALIDGSGSEEEHFNKWMPRLLLGRNSKIKPVELKNLKKGLTDSFEREVYQCARVFPIESAIKK